MAAIKAYTDIPQSKKLAKILPLESADNYYSWHDERYYIVNKYCPYPYSLREKIPCWSLAALLGVIPSSIKDSIGMAYSLNMNKEYIEYSNPNISSLYSAYIHTCGNDNLVDACYEMIIELHELNLL